MVLHWVAISAESRSENSDTPLKVRIAKAITPAPRPTPLPSFQPTPLTSPAAAFKNDRLTPLSEFPWAATSPVQTTISSGNAEGTSDDIETVPLDASKIHVKVKHEMSKSSLGRARREAGL
jgi:hypothetical protein